MSFVRKYLRLALLAASVAMYAYSLSLPALLFQHHDALTGGHILAWGWWGILMLQFAWIANPAYAFAVFCYVRTKRTYAAIACVVALFLGLTSFQAQEWWFNEGSGTPILGLGLGFRIWLLSFLILLVGCAISVELNQPINTDAGDETTRAG